MHIYPFLNTLKYNLNVINMNLESAENEHRINTIKIYIAFSFYFSILLTFITYFGLLLKMIQIHFSKQYELEYILLQIINETNTT